MQINKGEYTIESMPDAETDEYSLRRNGRWVRVGEEMRGSGSLHLGVARYYQDPHF